MDSPYRVEPATRGHQPPLSYDIVTSRDGVLCSTRDQVFAHKLVDLLNAEAKELNKPKRVWVGTPLKVSSPADTSHPPS